MEEIRIIKYKDIDFTKYKNCIKQSEQFSPFVDLEYLKLLPDINFEFIVLGDYHAIMPIPVKKILGVKLVVMPIHVQQLGIYSLKDDGTINERIINYFKKKYLIITYSFNEKNLFIENYPDKINYSIQCDTYENVKANYTVHRRRNVRILPNMQDKIQLKVNNTKIDDIIKFLKKNAIGAEAKNKRINNLLLLESHDLLKIYNLYYEGNIVSQAILTNFEAQKSLLYFINQKEYLKYNTSSILIDQILQREIEFSKFDFFGGNIDKIGDFFSRFGAIPQKYVCIDNSKRYKNLFSFREKY